MTKDVQMTTASEKGQVVIPQEIREEAQRKLAEERGMSLETGEEKQKAIKEALPAKGEAMVENLAGAAPAPIMPDYRTRRNDAITGLGDLALTDPELMSIQKQIVSAKAAATAARRELDSELLIPMLERFTNLLQGEEGRLKTAPSSELVSFQNIVKEIGTLDALMRGKGRAEDTLNSLNVDSIKTRIETNMRQVHRSTQYTSEC